MTTAHIEEGGWEEGAQHLRTAVSKQATPAGKESRKEREREDGRKAGREGGRKGERKKERGWKEGRQAPSVSFLCEKKPCEVFLLEGK